MRKDIALIAVIVATLALMVVPLNQTIIDVLLAVNISLSVILLMVAVYLKHPSDFATFPTVILLGTAFRLAMSVGTTRLILSEADAGEIIETFGDFVVSGSIAIGLVIFLIITVVQFLVVTKGAERVAEVGARFALDSLPGKQMSIDAEARAGDISAEDARVQRARLNKESQFFGAMDGAMKFVKGDAIAGIIIICVNLIGGVSVGISVHGLSFGEAVQTFSLLTVGDGLVAQIPALLMALCAGVIVTRVANVENDDLGSDIADELIADPRVPIMAAAIVVAIGFIPGFPTFVFLGLATFLVTLGFSLRRSIRIKKEAQLDQTEDNQMEDDGFPVSDRFRLILGNEIAERIDKQKLETLLSHQFHRLLEEGGVRFPRPDIMISDKISPLTFHIELDDVALFKSKLHLNSVLVLEEPKLLDLFAANDHLASPFLRGFWVPQDKIKDAPDIGLTIYELEEVLISLAFGYYQRNLGALFTIPLFKEVHESLRTAEPDGMELVDEDVAEAAFYKILKSLIEEGVPIRPYSLFVNSLYYWVVTQDAPTSQTLSECLRGSLKRQICNRVSEGKGILAIAMISPEIEQRARIAVSEARESISEEAANNIFLSLEDSPKFIVSLRDTMTAQTADGNQLALVISADLRRRLGNFLALHEIHVPILSPHEVSQEIPCLPVTLISLDSDITVSNLNDDDSPVEFFEAYRFGGSLKGA